MAKKVHAGAAPVVERARRGKLNYDIILEKVVEGKTPLSRIAEMAGSIAKTQQARYEAVDYAIKTPQFQAKLASLQERMEAESTRLMLNMEGSNLDSVEYRDKVQALTKLIEKVELLKGNATQRVGVDISEVKSFLLNA